MSEKAITLRQPAQTFMPARLQALASSLVLMIGAGAVLLLSLAALVVSLPLMLAASLTFDRQRHGRRGWQELETAPA
jgi:hypothetical protein